MSFYVGRKRTGSVTKRQCHITSGVHSLSTMEGEVFDKTIFHTDIDYVGYSTYHVTKNGYHWRKVLRDDDRHFSVYDRYTTYSNNTTMRNLIQDGYAFMVVVGKMEAGTHNKANPEYGCTFAQTAFADSGTMYFSQDINAQNVDGYGPIVNGRWTSYKDGQKISNQTGGSSPNKGVYYSIRADGAPSSLTFVVFNFKSNGTINNVMNKLSKEVLLKGTTSVPALFHVDGKDILGLKYIRFGKVNSIDPVIHTDMGDMQLVNFVSNGDGVEINTSNGRTTVKAGNSVIIDSDKGSTGLKIIEKGMISIPAKTLVPTEDPWIHYFGPTLLSGQTMFISMTGGLDNTVTSMPAVYGQTSANTVSFFQDSFSIGGTHPVDTRAHVLEQIEFKSTRLRIVRDTFMVSSNTYYGPYTGTYVILG